MVSLRSKAYPAIDLESAVQRTELIQRNLGSNTWFNRQAIATGMGYKSLSGVANRAIAALVHFGLLERRKDTYKISDLASHIVLPISDEDRIEAILTALREPELYSELLNNYGHGQLPNALPNILAHSHGINPNASNLAANAFITSAEYAGILQDGVFRVPQTNVNIDSQKNEEPSNHVTGHSEESANNSQGQDDNNSNVFVRKLPSGVAIGFPSTLDYAVMIGEFGSEIAAIERKAQEYLSINVEGKGPAYEKAETERNV
jgi:hypothetical protein